MNDPFSFLQGLGTKSLEFWDELKSIGVELKNEHIAEEYKGDNFDLKYQLVLKKGLFSKEVILGSDDKSDLDTIKSYVGYFPQFHSLIITEAPVAIISSNYALKHVSKMNGVTGKESQIEQIVRKWNGGHEATDYILNSVEETLLGFFPFSDSKQVKAYTDLVNAGAFREATPEEVAEMQSLVANYANKLKKK